MHFSLLRREVFRFSVFFVFLSTPAFLHHRLFCFRGRVFSHTVSPRFALIRGCSPVRSLAFLATRSVAFSAFLATRSVASGRVPHGNDNQRPTGSGGNANANGRTRPKRAKRCDGRQRVGNAQLDNAKRNKRHREWRAASGGDSRRERRAFARRRAAVTIDARRRV